MEVNRKCWQLITLVSNDVFEQTGSIISLSLDIDVRFLPAT